MTNHLCGKTVLLTGAGGSIGSALAHAIAKLGPQLIILVDQSEERLNEVSRNLRSHDSSVPYEPIPCNICDLARVAKIFERYRPHIVYHAAALKDVPSMETKPIEAIQTNAIATNLIVRVARASGVEAFTLISTDKAANPRSIMGASKRVAELVVLRWAGSKSLMRAIRLGNVMWSRGSVLPLFKKQILAGGPVTVTHPEITRYFINMEDAVTSILRLAQLAAGSGLFVPNLGAPKRILQIATEMIQANAHSRRKRIRIEFSGLRPGDKMNEDLISNIEALEPLSGTNLFRIIGHEMKRETFDDQMTRLTKCVESRDVSGMLKTVVEVVPDYVPSDALLALKDRSAA